MLLSAVAVYALVLAAEIAEEVKEVEVILDAQTISFLCGVLIPLLVGVLTKVNASSGLKAVVNALLSALAGALAAFTQTGLTGDVDWKTLILSMLSTWIVSVATYYGIWKPTGVAGTVNVKTGRFGVGSPPDMETDEKWAA